MRGLKLLIFMIAFYVITAMIIYNTSATVRPPSVNINFNLIKYDNRGNFWAVARNFFAMLINVVYGIATTIWSVIQILIWMINIVSYSFTFSYIPDPGLRTGLTVVFSLVFVYALITSILEVREGV